MGISCGKSGRFEGSCLEALLHHDVKRHPLVSYTWHARNGKATNAQGKSESTDAFTEMLEWCLEPMVEEWNKRWLGFRRTGRGSQCFSVDMVLIVGRNKRAQTMLGELSSCLPLCGLLISLGPRLLWPVRLWPGLLFF